MESLPLPPPPIEPAINPPALRPLRVLIADDSEDDAFLLLRALRKAGYEPDFERISNGPAMQAALQRREWEIVISDFEMPGFGGLEALEVLKRSGKDIPFILISAVLSEETAVAALKAGAHDYMMKRKFARLGPAIERELRDVKTRAARRTAEAALKQSEEQFRHTQKIEAVGRLAASVAHDFNNIITAILGHSELLLRQLEPGNALRKNVEPIEKCAHMAATLTKQLLAFSRKDASSPRVLQLNDVILNLEKMLHRLIGADIKFQTVIDPQAGTIKADSGQMEQVVMNLVVNARDALPNGGNLTITTANVRVDGPASGLGADITPGDYVLLSIADTGIGMSDAVKARLFEPFFTTKPPGKGTGLGLATCFGIVKQNGGHIQVDSELSKGTVFRIYFPHATA